MYSMFLCLTVFFCLSNISVVKAEVTQKYDLQEASLKRSEAFEKYIVENKKRTKARSVASAVEPNASDVTKELSEFYKKFDGVQNAEQLHALITEYDQRFIVDEKGTANGTQVDDRRLQDLSAKFVVTQFSLLQAFRSFAFKTSPIYENRNFLKTVEENENSENSGGRENNVAKWPSKVITSAVVGQIRDIASYLSVNLPTPQWAAGFDYIIAPGVADADNRKINNMSELQTYVEKNVIPAFEKAVLRLRHIYGILSPEKAIVVDARIFYMTATFPETVDQYKVIYPADVAYTLSAIEGALHALHFFCAYNLDALPKFLAEVGKVKGLGGFLPTIEPGSTASSRIGGVLRGQIDVWDLHIGGGKVKKKYRDLFVIRGSDGSIGKNHMKRALWHLRLSVRAGVQAWVDLNDTDLLSHYELLDFIKIKPYEREINRRLSDYIALIYGIEKIGDLKSFSKIVPNENGAPLLNSAVTGDSVKINFAEFYNSPPTDLKKLIAIKFSTDESKWIYPKDKLGKTIMKSSDGEDLSYRNYYWGKVTEWEDLKLWQKYIPSITKQSDVPNSVRVLSQAWGSGLGSVLYFSLVK